MLCARNIAAATCDSSAAVLDLELGCTLSSAAVWHRVALFANDGTWSYEALLMPGPSEKLIEDATAAAAAWAAVGVLVVVFGSLIEAPS